MSTASGRRLIWAGGAIAALAFAGIGVVVASRLGLDLPIFTREWTSVSQNGAVAPSPPSAGAPSAPPRAAAVEPGAADKAAPTQAASALATAQQQASGLAALLAPVVPPAAESDGPSFDVVSVEPTGETVVAGRAAPGATVELLRNGEPHAQAVADRAGQFSMVPPPLRAGTFELTLRAKLPDGREMSSKQSVAVVVEAGKRPPTVAVVAPDQPTRVLSKPAASAPLAVAVEAVDFEPNGNLRVSGLARPGATVRIYLNDRLVSTATASADGRVAVVIKDAAWAGKDRLRLDEVDAKTGAVQARAEVPLNVPETLTTAALPAAAGQGQANGGVSGARTQLAAASPADLKDMASSPGRGGGARTITVSRGDSLWHISRRLLGEGTRYAVIYRANREQIRRPDLIYPGQVFVLPAKR
ncbi:LysM peptidoglycan-binding domain-containing protein [Bradyrhizobium aeschynomenes]|uniref:LysM peptidoglycan-binding domain-containing protein n=1 Tax=Bradyrhizobium aeschynomenes TaxID=2734909 RepID=UPI0015540721|nr:LysM peptidoglycan-binding domain-containing protein [Bradyrhizobium aeschynomenes]NPV23323.1 LysM peptidoglycan-binding domain-containing protein [Bradyrhizobium aeschynomenes]